jgi:hypothetical protein
MVAIELSSAVLYVAESEFGRCQARCVPLRWQISHFPALSTAKMRFRPRLAGSAIAAGASRSKGCANRHAVAARATRARKQAAVRRIAIKQANQGVRQFPKRRPQLGPFSYCMTTAIRSRRRMIFCGQRAGERAGDLISRGRNTFKVSSQGDQLAHARNPRHIRD